MPQEKKRPASPRRPPATPLALSPAAWNILGLFPVVAGALGLAWVFSVGFAQFPKLPPVVELDEGKRLLTATSRVLITHGPFACSRNPMFLAGMFMLLGWAIFYGRPISPPTSLRYSRASASTPFLYRRLVDGAETISFAFWSIETQ